MGSSASAPSGVSPGSPSLVLFPTELEARRFADLGGLPQGLALTAISGFGAVAAAARTARLLSELRPARVLLVGIAGTFDSMRHPVGSALEFDAVAIDGIGVGEGERFVPPPALGFPQWPGASGPDPSFDRPIFDRIELARPACEPEQARALLLTTCAASADREQARARRARFPEAVAEDMEGFAVALACALASAPLCIVRGISNEVGDRESSHWRIPQALAAARKAAIAVLESGAAWRLAL